MSSCAEGDAIPSPPYPGCLLPELNCIFLLSFSLHEMLSNPHSWFWGVLPPPLCLSGWSILIHRIFPHLFQSSLQLVHHVSLPDPPCSFALGAGPSGEDPKELTLFNGYPGTSPQFPGHSSLEPAILLRISAGRQSHLVCAAVGNRDGAESRSPLSGDTEEGR